MLSIRYREKVGKWFLQYLKEKLIESMITSIGIGVIASVGSEAGFYLTYKTLTNCLICLKHIKNQNLW